MAKVYYDHDADVTILKGKRIAVIGYGIQGRGQALNLRDSRLEVVVAQRPGGAHYEQAIQDGWKPMLANVAAKQADIIQLLVQDMAMPQLYQEGIAPHLRPGKALGFSHGFNIHFKQIVPPNEVDVFMVAPKAPGSLLRKQFEEGRGVPCLLAVHQDHTGKAKQIALAYAKGIGGTRAGVLETTFQEETETDLFGEQTVLCGGVSELIKAGFETLVKHGYQPELAYFECLHELKLIVDMIAEHGIQGMRQRVSETARFGDLTRGPRVIGEATRNEMEQILKEIRSGEFAKEWIADAQNSRKRFNALMQRDANHLIEQVGAKLRSLMSWVKSQS